MKDPGKAVIEVLEIADDQASADAGSYLLGIAVAQLISQGCDAERIKVMVEALCEKAVS